MYSKTRIAFSSNEGHSQPRRRGGQRTRALGGNTGVGAVEVSPPARCTHSRVPAQWFDLCVTFHLFAQKSPVNQFLPNLERTLFSWT